MAYKRFVDLSVSIEDGLPCDPPFMIPRVQYHDHNASVAGLLEFFPSLRKEDLPGGMAWAIEFSQLSSHSGTHLDAPWHYHPTMDGGRRASTIDEIPLEWCFSDGVVLNLSHLPDGCLVGSPDLRAALEKIDYQLKPLDIVLVYTGASQYWGKAEYIDKGCGMGREATLWLLDQGIRITGTDAWSWDRPFSVVAKEYMESRDSSVIWEGHYTGIEKGYCHLEKLINLDQLPGSGFKVACFPVKIKAASAGWVRAVAMW